MRRECLAMLLSWIFVAVLTATAQQADQAQQFSPFGAAQSEQPHFNLERVYFPSRTTEETQRANLSKSVLALCSFFEAPSLTPERLGNAITEYQRVQAQLDLHNTYLYLLYATDTRKTDASTSSEQVQVDGSRLQSCYERHLLGLSDVQLRSMYTKVPRMRSLQFAFENVRMRRGHILSDSEEHLLAQVQPGMTGWQQGLVGVTLHGTDFGSIATPEGNVDLAKNIGQLLRHPDPQVRESAFTRNLEGLKSRREIYAFALAQVVQMRKRLASIRKFENYPTEAYSQLYLSPAEVERLLQKLSSSSEVNRRYEQYRRGEVTRNLGIKDAHVWDLRAPDPGQQVPQFTFSDAARTIMEAVRPFGSQYVGEMQALLDPRNGRLDVVPSEFKVRRSGFSNGGPGRPSILYMESFTGTLEDLLGLAHEAGHAVQFMLMNANTVPYFYTTGPNYFTESFAVFNELLVLDQLAQHAKTPSQRRFFERAYVDRMTQCFQVGYEALFEHLLYTRASPPQNAEGFESLMQETGAQFSTWYGPGSDRQMEWIQPVQFFTRPLYRINYVYANLLALAYMEALKRDAVDFAPKYMRLLSQGYYSAPERLLSETVGISLDQDSLVENALSVIEMGVRDYERPQ